MSDELDMLVRARGDQFCAMLHEELDQIRTVTAKDPEHWDRGDKELARHVLMGVKGLLLEGRI